MYIAVTKVLTATYILVGYISTKNISIKKKHVARQRAKVFPQ